MGDEMCSDSVFNNTDVLSFQSTLAIQKSKKNTIRKIRIYLKIAKNAVFLSPVNPVFLFREGSGLVEIYCIFLYCVPKTLVRKLLVEKLLVSEFGMTRSLIIPKY